MRISGQFVVSAVSVTCCLLLGGATGVGHVSDAILQLTAIPLLLASLGRLDARAARQIRGPLLFVVALALVPLLQLIPLPPGVWINLPGREPIVATFGLPGRDLPWLPISVSPYATWLSALSLLPPTAVFLATLLLGYRERRLLSLVVLALGAISVFVGLSQVAQGPNSSLRFFEITNPTEAVGFFANRNHFAALLYVLTLLAAAWVVETTSGAEAGRGRHDTPRILALVASLAILILLVSTQAIARSRAGLGLTIVALFGAFALAFSERRNASSRTPARVLIGAITVVAVLVVQYGLYRILDRFAVDPLSDARIVLARNTIAAAKAFMPFGSGMGTFVPVYALFEKPADALMDTFINRAHNDVLELWLEAGSAAVGLLSIFLLWLAITSVRIWRNKHLPERAIDRLLPCAASLIVALVVAHSFVDYPLRTGAMMAMLALACALMIGPPAVAEGEKLQEAGDGNVKEKTRYAQTAAATPAARRPLETGPPRRPGELWGEHMRWPEEWRRPDAKD